MNQYNIKMSLEKIVIENGTLITPFEKLDNKDREITRVVIENGEIVFAGLEEDNEENNKKYKEYTKINAKDKIVTPGFMDSHVHLNADFKGVDDICEKIEQQRRTFLGQGVTSYMLSTMAMPNLGLEDMLDAVRIESKCRNGAELFGVVIEGPFTNPKMAGAMNTQFVSTQPKFFLNGLINDYEDILKKIVLAPEMHPNYYDFIKKIDLRERKDVILSIGHSNADYKQAVQAINKGIRVINHFYNRISGFHHRDLGIIGAVFNSIKENELYLELIADGIHVCPDAISFLTEEIKLRGQKNWEDIIMLITDAINIVTPLENDSETGYEIKKIDGKKIYYIGGAPYMEPDKKTLFGSVLKMDDAVRNMISFGYSPISAVKSATETPAKAHYLDKKGSIKKGNDADIVIFNKNEEKYFGEIQCTFVNGAIAYLSEIFKNRIVRR